MTFFTQNATAATASDGSDGKRRQRRQATAENFHSIPFATEGKRDARDGMTV